GEHGNQRICWNGQSTADMQLWLNGDQVWYSDWGYREAGKVHARLTFNPYFEWQSEVVVQVLEAAGTLAKYRSRLPRPVAGNSFPKRPGQAQISSLTAPTPSRLKPVLRSSCQRPLSLQRREPFAAVAQVGPHGGAGSARVLA